MINCRPNAAVGPDNARAELPSSSTKIVSFSLVKSSAEIDRAERPVVTTAPAIPGSDAVRAILVLTAETAFELEDGIRNGPFAVQLETQCENLSQSLKEAPAIHKGADRGLMLRRARRAFEIMEETIRREILDKVDKNTDPDEVDVALHAVKDAAERAGKELILIGVMNFRI